ncbi:unnamed protein product [Rhodiola kirilowii]
MKSRTSTGNVMKSTQAVQMGGGVNPNWWSIRPAPPATTITSYEQQQQHHHPPYNLNFLHQPPNNNNFLPSYNPPNSIILSPYSPQPTSSSNSSSWHEHDNHQQQQDHHQQLPSETWSQLLLGGMDQEEGEKQSAAATAALTHQQFQTAANKLKMHNWDQSPVMLQQQHLHDLNYESPTSIMDIKKEHQSVPSSCYNMFGHGNEEFLQAAKTTAAWSSINVMMSNNSSPPKSCVTSFGNNNNNSMLNFSSNSKGDNGIRHPAPVDHPSESNSSGTGGASKKARVQPSPPDQSNTFKVRKEKLGDRITALHQLVSPFGKTDTASVLLETMGYIRFLQSQIEALSLPYLASGVGSTRQQHQQQQQPLMHAQSESICIFPEDPGQESSEKEPEKDLRSRGLCLVPLSCTLQVESDNGADYWASPPAFGGGFR